MASGDLQQPSQCFKGRRQEDGARLFAVLCSGSVTENGHKLKQWRFRLVIREKKFSLRMKQEPSETAGSFLGVFQELTVKK